MSDKNVSKDDGTAEAVLMALILAVAFAGWLSFSIVDMALHPVKSDRELCQERGGVWVAGHHVQARCFAREAFK